MDKQTEDQVKAGVSIFVQECSVSGIECTPVVSSHAGMPVRFQLARDNKGISIACRFEFITDLPATKEYLPALRFYMSALSLKFREPGLSEYLTLNGIPIAVRIDFPFRMSLEGGSFESVHVLLKTVGNKTYEAKLSLRLADTVGVNIVSLDSIITEPIVVNAVRKDIDENKVTLHAEGTHPTELQAVTIQSTDYDYKARRFVFNKSNDEDIERFLKRKVYWLGFRRGTQSTQVCVAHPYDAEYLGVSVERLQQSAAILAADEILQIDPSGSYASAGINLLREARKFDTEFTELTGTQSGTSVALQLQPDAPAMEPPFDVFVSHATEDKAYVGPLIKELQAAGIRVWYDNVVLEWGDDLRTSIDRGLTACRYGIVVFSKAFLRKKKWTEYELNSLFAREKAGRKLILPIWHGVTRDDVIQYGPGFADRLAKISSADGYPDIVESLLGMLGRARSHEHERANTPESFTDFDQWPHLLKLGSWELDSNANIHGTGVYEFLLSHRVYGKRDFRIKANLTFLNYDQFRDPSKNRANAGIVLGWQERNKGHRYYNLLFTGNRLLLEAIGFSGSDDYRDFEHLNDGVSLIIDEKQTYDVGVSVTDSALDVFIDNQLKYSVATPPDLVGRVGLRPWRAKIRCSKFLISEA